uniref:Uncharacterized protein n=1 Tax=Anguilla anguilla TaxID=7936 RepID=A0A0E9S8Z0_ANGAN
MSQIYMIETRRLFVCPCKCFHMSTQFHWPNSVSLGLNGICNGRTR